MRVTPRMLHPSLSLSPEGESRWKCGLGRSKRNGDNVKTRVYYADTDAGGVVYYANYLRWLEMGRFEFLEQFGKSVTEYARA